MRNILIAALLASVLVHVSGSLAHPHHADGSVLAFNRGPEPTSWTREHNRYRSVRPGQAVSP